MQNVSFEKINAVALPLLRTLVTEWVPGGKFRGKEYVAGSIRGGKGESFSVNVTNGKWADFSSNGTDRGGDAISLYAAVFTSDDQKRAADELATRLAISDETPLPETPRNQPKDWEQVEPDANTPEPNLSRWERAWPYHNHEGRITHYVVRKGNGKDKIILALTWGRKMDEKTGELVLGWHLKQPKAPRPLYRLNGIAKAKSVIICEGEKAADAAQLMFPRILCTTWMAGTNNVANADWSPLSGKKVLIWPDNDEPGHKAADEIASILSGIAASVSKLEVSDLPEKADAADVAPENPSEWLKKRAGSVIGGKETQAPPVARGRRAANLAPIRVTPGEIDLVTEQGERALIASGYPVFVRAGELVTVHSQDGKGAEGTPNKIANITPVTPFQLTKFLCAAVSWEIEHKKSGQMIEIDPPPAVANTILSNNTGWAFPQLEGAITTPALRPDGTVIVDYGYDAATKLFLVPNPYVQVVLPDPSLEAARAAVALLDGLLAECPFLSKTDHAVALAAILTAATRDAMPSAPLFAIRASTPGIGKSFLVNLTSVIATGNNAAITSVPPADPAEAEKRVSGMLLMGEAVISLDNVNGELGSDFLCIAVERPMVNIRPLCTSKSISIENRHTIFATGNGLRMTGDMARRSVVCNLYSNEERPELRQYKGKPVQDVILDRGKYVAACLTIVQSFMSLGVSLDIKHLASFEGWSRTVRSSLIWLGYPDPCDSMSDVRDEDPEMEAMRSLIWTLGNVIGVGREKAKTCGDIERISRSEWNGEFGKQGPMYSELQDAIAQVAGGGNPRSVATRLGKWLSNKSGRIIDGRRIINCGFNSNKSPLWAIEVI